MSDKAGVFLGFEWGGGGVLTGITLGCLMDKCS